MSTESRYESVRDSVMRPRMRRLPVGLGNHFATPELGPFQRLLRKPAFAIPAGFAALLVAMFATVGLILLLGIVLAGASLQAAVPLTSQARDQIEAGDISGLKKTLDKFNTNAQVANVASSTFVWRAAESVPGIGENLRAVRLISSLSADISTNVIAPGLDLMGHLKNPEGGVNAQGIAQLVPRVEGAFTEMKTVSAELASLDGSQLVGPLQSGVTKFQEAMTQVSEAGGPALSALKLLPDMLGVNGPKNYLLLFANNAEVRAGIGNPGSMAQVTVDNGSIKITGQAGSQNFAEGAGFKLDPETESLYGEKVGNQVQDITYTPYFDETAKLARQFWATQSPAKIDGVVMTDPVALSYILAATGPVPVADGITLTSENAVRELLNEIYIRYENKDDINIQAAQQKAFFNKATEAIFAAVTRTDNITGLFKALSQAASEGRLLYNSNNPEQMALIADTRIAGPLPPDNSKKTIIGVFFQYNLAAKMDYYFDSTVTGTTTQCTVTGNTPATFTAATTVKNIITQDVWQKLPWYISGTNLWQKGGIYRDVVVYGPVGTKVKTVKVDGLVKNVPGRWGDDYRVSKNRDRPVVQVPIFVDMQKSATVTVTFEATAKQQTSSFGPFDIHVTPTVRNTPVTVERPGCQ